MRGLFTNFYYKLMVGLIFISLLSLALFNKPVKAAYRAYYLEVYDMVLQNNWEVITGFPLSSYLASFRKNEQVKLTVKASWLCHGNTAFKDVCPMPAPINPKFTVGDLVEVNLPKHLTDGWQGTIEVILWRSDLGSNIYGVNFSGRLSFYGNYYEHHLTTP